MGLRIVTTEPDDFRARVVIPLPRRPGGPNPERRRLAVLEPRTRRPQAFQLTELPLSVRIAIADGASIHRTRPMAERLAATSKRYCVSVFILVV